MQVCDKDRVVGLDFDNTLVSYDDVVHSVALERGLISGDLPRCKRAVRDRVRQLPDGENEWQRIQAAVYGPRIEGARSL